MTLDEKLEIVSKNYAKKYIEDVNVKSMIHKAYCEGFKAGYKKATTNENVLSGENTLNGIEVQE